MKRSLLLKTWLFLFSLFLGIATISAQCEAIFTFHPDSSNHKKIIFINNSTFNGNLSKFEWKFGNEGGDTANYAPTFEFSADGQYEVCFMLINDAGCADTVCHTIKVEQQQNDCNADFHYQNGSANPLEVSFQDNSYTPIGNITTWYWDFGDTQTSSDQNPVHTYTQEGDYNVCLTITTSDSCTKTFCSMIHAGGTMHPCKAEVSMNKDTTVQTLTFKFEAHEWNLDTNAESHTWWIDQQQVSTNQNFMHTFAAEGSYEICYAVKTLSGCEDTVCQQMPIGQGPNCEASYHYDVQNGTRNVVFQDASQSTTGIVSWKWDFGDTHTSTDPNPQHEYANDGEYNVCLTIVSSDSCTQTYCNMVGVGAQPCMANFNDFYQGGLSYGFEDKSSAPNGIQSFTWDVGDGNTYTTSNFTHAYTTAGDYNVCLAIAGDQCVDTLCRNIHVSDQQQGGSCQPDYNFTQDTQNDKLFTFTDATQLTDGSITSWEWDFGDGNKSFDQNPSHEYTAEGMYTVCLKIMTDKNCEETHCDFVSIGNVSCHAEFGWDPTGTDKEYKFTNYSYSDTTISTFSWGIEGSVYSIENPTHTFSDTGVYEVELIIVNVTGCVDTVKKEVHISGGNQHSGGCSADFSWNSNGGDGSSFNFNDQSFADNGISNWSWDMGDGYTYNNSGFTHAYSADGNYNVCLVIEDNTGTCRDTICNSVQVQINQNNHNGGDDKLMPIQDCLASFWAVKDPTDPKKFMFKSNSAHQDTNITLNHTWNINGSQYSGEEAQHMFTAKGKYDVELTVTGAGCVSTVKIPVEAGSASGCSVGYTYVVDSMDANRVHFALSGTDNLTGGFWQFGDGTQADQKDPIHHFPGPGFYDVCVNAYDSASGCQTQFCYPIEIEGQTQGGNCFAQFEATPNQLSVQFNNKSQGDFTNVHYMFGDGHSSDDPNPSHTYTTAGVFDVCMTVFDSISNCVADFCMPITVFADSNDVYCHADFDFFPIGEKKFAFANHSKGNFTEVKWELNGGANTMKQNEIEYEFAHAGHHNVCLNIFDSISGCHNQICKTVEIVDSNVTNCLADFSFFKDATGKIAFNSEAKGTYTNVHFDLGDGNFRDKEQFAHMYNGAGHYSVCMSIKDTLSGCQDQICKMVAFAPDSVQNFCQAKFDGYMDDNGVAHAQNKSVGDYTHSTWDFGDGHQSFDNNPTHAFKNSGFYTICLSIFDSISGCQSTFCEDVNIQLDSADVNCHADFKSMIIDGEVSVKNNSVGDYTKLHWAFGDGGFANGEEANHYYNKTGVYDICLAIWDSTSGCQAKICKPVTIVKDTMDVFCEAKFEHMKLPNGEIQFKDASVGSYTHIHWDLGNGVFANHTDPIGHYPNGGVFPVSIMIWDSINGCQASYKEEIVISGNVSKPECHAKFNFFPVNDTLVKFENSSTGDYTNIHWEFGDGTFAENVKGTEHAYSKGGFYNVCVGIFDSISGCHDFVCNNVELLLDTTIVDCHAEFEFFPISKTEVAFNNISAGHFTHAYWKFGNGDVSYDLNPTIDFAGTGLYGACLTVRDSVSGCQDEMCVKVPLIDDTTVYCDANFGYFVDGNTVKFEPEIKGNITGWVWDFNDGFNSNDSFPSHTFTKDGVYEVCLTVFDSVSGCFNTFCDGISIATNSANTNAHIEAGFSYYLDPTDGKVYFKDESVGNPTSWYWDFGDGDSAGVAQNPNYEYTEDGYYEVCLTSANDNGGQETVCEVISVGDVTDACFAKFDYYANAVTATAHFDNKSLGRITEYHWDFGDTINSAQFKPAHTYADTGFYAVCLTVSNDSGCTRTFCKEIRVGNALENKCLIGCVWPGDANLDLEANHYDILPMGLHYGETGPARKEVSSDWRGHESQDWSSFLWGDVNNKHGDANGDGIIDITDLEIIEQNFAYSHPWQPRSNTSNQLSIDWDVDDIDVGETAVLTVSIPDSINVSMYGLGFEIDLDPAVFDYNSISYDFSNSWLGTQGSDLITFGLDNENLGQIYIAESRNDHNELTGNGELVRITVTAKAKSASAGAVLTTEGGVTAKGDTVKFSGAEDQANVNSIEERDGYLIKQLVVFPNPTSDKITYNLPTASATEYLIEVRDNIGKLVYSTIQQNGGQVTTKMTEFNSGVYTIQVTTDKVKYMQKVILTK